MVTSFRPRCPNMRDDSVLTTIRAVSDLPELYLQYSEYRLEILEERIRQQLKTLRESKRGFKKLNTRILKKFLRDQELFLGHMNKEIVENDQVQAGVIDDSHLLYKGDSKMRPKKRAKLE